MDSFVHFQSLKPLDLFLSQLRFYVFLWLSMSPTNPGPRVRGWHFIIILFLSPTPQRNKHSCRECSFTQIMILRSFVFIHLNFGICRDLLSRSLIINLVHGVLVCYLVALPVLRWGFWKIQNRVSHSHPLRILTLSEYVYVYEKNQCSRYWVPGLLQTLGWPKLLQFGAPHIKQT